MIKHKLTHTRKRAHMTTHTRNLLINWITLLLPLITHDTTLPLYLDTAKTLNTHSHTYRRRTHKTYIQNNTHVIETHSEKTPKIKIPVYTANTRTRTLTRTLTIRTTLTQILNLYRTM